MAIKNSISIFNYFKQFCIIIFYLIAFVALFTQYVFYAFLSIIAFTVLLFHQDILWICKMIPRDISFTVFLFKMIIGTKIAEMKNMTIVKAFQIRVRKHPNKIAFIHEDRKWTYTEVDEYSNRVANYLKIHGVKQNDIIALFMENKPEYVFIWLGVTKIRAITALINTNLRKEALHHSLTVVNITHIIYGSELIEAISEIKGQLDGLNIFTFDSNNVENPEPNLCEGVKNVSPEPPSEDIANASIYDRILYIYTSGTTGFPKAAVINNLRAIYMVYSMKFGFNITDKDILYTTLPLYHSAGGILGSGQSLIGGTTQVIRTKFSASYFWKDCIKYNCTMAQYIGEMCRYLLSLPVQPEETQHNLRLIFGNGLRQQIWDEFVKRFKIPKIGEIYGSTEGNANILNAWNKPGAVGYLPLYAAKLYPVNLIRINMETGEPIRDANGICIKCKAGEPGLLVGKINPNQAISSYEGYNCKKASSNKIICDVFSKGDKAFNTGDILVRDEQFYYYFKDRTGDTFRWKGENVATQEVEAIISNIVKLKDVNVYGVEIPHTEGKAGMAAIEDENNNNIDLEKFSEEVKKLLPTYAIPRFIRIIKQANLTGTFKFSKIQFQEEGFNLNIIEDRLYYLNEFGKYEILTKDTYNKILNREIKL